MKKLLILGATRDECQIVNAAKQMGVYTITTDNHTDWNLAPAKLISDEAWNISWSDIPQLKRKCIDSHVDGVLAGYSEFRTNCAIQLCKELSLNFYIEDEKQLAITRNKDLFKNICRQYGVPVVKEYNVSSKVTDKEADLVSYPVVVKPVDNAGSRGIKTCYNKDTLQKCVDYALSYSESKRFLVEKLIKGYEVVAYYTLADGKIVLSSMFDKYARIEGDGFNSLPDAYLYPSRSLDVFIKNYNEKVITMLKGMGLKNGVVSLQGFAVPNGELNFFELGFRLGGTSAFHYTEHFNHVNHLKMLINYSLYGEMGKDLLSREDPYFSGKYGCTFTLLSKDGVIGAQDGIDSVEVLENVLYSCFYHAIGDKIVVDGSQFPKTFRSYIVGQTIEDIKDTISKIQNRISVVDVDGHNMLYPPFNVNQLDRKPIY